MGRSIYTPKTIIICPWDRVHDLSNGPWTIAIYPWDRVHMDHGPLQYAHGTEYILFLTSHGPLQYAHGSLQYAHGTEYILFLTSHGPLQYTHGTEYISTNDHYNMPMGQSK